MLHATAELFFISTLIFSTAAIVRTFKEAK
jgi:hypothetical protein